MKTKKITIGRQLWSTENLNVTKFRNGDPIPRAKSAVDWIEALRNEKPAWCSPLSHDTYNREAGKLYNWFAVSDPRGLALEGWRIPNEDDIKHLISHLRGPRLAAIKLKSKQGWADMDLGYTGKHISGNGTNESEYNAIPIPQRNVNGKYEMVDYSQSYWLKDESKSDLLAPTFTVGEILNQYLCGDSALIMSTRKGNGFPVRILKDSEWHFEIDPKYHDEELEMRHQLNELRDVLQKNLNIFGV